MHTPAFTRRQAMRLTAIGALGTSLFTRTERVAAMQPSLPSMRTLTGKLKTEKSHGSAASLLPRRYGGEDRPPQPANYDMLRRAWHEAQMRRLLDQTGERGIGAILLREPANVTHYTGYTFSPTERPQAVFMNKDDGAPWYFYPMVDSGLVRAGWFGGGRLYFDYPHAAGGFPNEGKVVTGPAVDLLEFMLEGIREKGVQGTKIGIDGELYPFGARHLSQDLAEHRSRRYPKPHSRHAQRQDARRTGVVEPGLRSQRSSPGVRPGLLADLWHGRDRSGNQDCYTRKSHSSNRSAAPSKTSQAPG